MKYLSIAALIFIPISTAHATPCNTLFDRILDVDTIRISGSATVNRVQSSFERSLTTPSFYATKTSFGYQINTRLRPVNQLHRPPAPYEDVTFSIANNSQRILVHLQNPFITYVLNNPTCFLSSDGKIAQFSAQASYSRSNNTQFENWVITFTIDPGFRYDTSTQCTVGGVTMHCCPAGEAMIGAHIGRNTFKCSNFNNAFSGRGRFADSTTSRNGMRACPLGAAMVGYHHGRNTVACEYPDPVLEWDFIDTNSSDNFPMHVCRRSVMAGIDVPSNRFTCAFH